LNFLLNRMDLFLNKPPKLTIHPVNLTLQPHNSLLMLIR
jgi:hypothetical protein